MTLKIAIASGKGGTGKTTVATNLATVMSGRDRPVAFLDCDVEEPNGHIFLNPVIHRQNRVCVPVPEVDESACTYCGECARVCQFSAILALKNKVLTFPKLCHACGGCQLACPENAIREVPREIGTIEQGVSNGLAFIHGSLEVGEAMAPPVIREVLNTAPPGYDLVLDAPPGTSCPVIESIKDADVVLLVTEPTPFGLCDLKLAVEVVRSLGLPFGVAVNRVGTGDGEVFGYCDRENIPVLVELPDDRRIAEAYSRGELVVRALPELEGRFRKLLEKLSRLATGGSTGPTGRIEPLAMPGEQMELPSDSLPPGQTGQIEELVVVSGKGGTGKTSVVASLFALSDGALVADCDVDAADLHLVLNPQIEKRWPFSGGSLARIDSGLCDQCGLCVEHCRFDAVREDRKSGLRVDPIACEGCGVCRRVCPHQAVELIQPQNGEWFLSKTRFGPMVHARLGAAQENSGKLVSLVRREARAVADGRGRDLLLVDGSPGIGCPVIASITGASAALVVCEPTLSALHDMKRLAELTRHFKVKTVACINKADINPGLADQIEGEARDLDIPVLGRIGYHPAVTQAQVECKSVVEIQDNPAARGIRALWERIRDVIR